MIVVQINSFADIGSTGKISSAISDILTNNNIENYIIYSLGHSKKKNRIKNSTRLYSRIQALESRVFGNYGFTSGFATKKLIHKLNRIKPDVIHLHNIHSHDCNLKQLFDYIKKNNIKVFWTFHDCWAFTGYCTHFTAVECNNWQVECKNCCQYKKYSWFFDFSTHLFKAKKKALGNVDLTIITPSNWLAKMVSQSFLSNYDIYTINNGIDLSIFRPKSSNFREKYDIENKKVILGVAFNWGYKKGLDIFVKLSEILDSSYQIVLVGTNSKIDEILPGNIISIHKTYNQNELADIYSAADIFLNTTREDTFPTVNIEALACGTPVVTSNIGGSPEIIDESTGIVVDMNNIDYILNAIKSLCKTEEIQEKCVSRAKRYNVDNCFEKYYELYLNAMN